MLDSQTCFEIIFTFERIISEQAPIIINGLDSAGNNVHREIFKVAKTHLYDRAMSCLIALINQNNFVYTNELEGNVTLDFRALDGSNNEVLLLRELVAEFILTDNSPNTTTSLL
ncbi:unnamed protein product [Rotaria sp. Silwood1]|nr:unnamed protein product [Rotaria sp. Silwood1]